MKLRLIPPGEFLMGSSEAEIAQYRGRRRIHEGHGPKRGTAAHCDANGAVLSRGA